METAFMLLLFVTSLIFLITPIAYTFLNLADKIGPEDATAAAWLGVFLWIAGIGGFGLLIEILQDLIFSV